MALITTASASQHPGPGPGLEPRGDGRMGSKKGAQDPLPVLLKFFFFKKFNFCIFKGYLPLTAITKYWLYSPCCTIHPWAYLTPKFVPPTPHMLPQPRPPNTLNHWFVPCTCGSASFMLYSLVRWVFLDSTYKRYHTVFLFLCLTHFT